MRWFTQYYRSVSGFLSLAALLCLPVAYAEGQDNGLVAYWKFDEGNGSIVRDASGNELHGTVRNPRWVQGKTGMALDFENGGYVEVSDHPVLRLQNDFTITAWIRKANPSKKGKSMGIISKSSQDAWDFDLFMSTSQLEHPAFYSDAFKAPEGDIEVISASPITLDEWHHLAVTRGGADARIFVDGRLTGIARCPERLPDTSRNLLIGYDHDGQFRGLIDEVRIYDRALPNQEIAGLMDGYSSTQVKNFTHTIVDEKFGGIREIADIDRDHHPDIVHAFWYNSAPLSWYELQEDGTWKPNVIRENFYPVTDNFDIADMDGDGDHDVIMATSAKKRSSDPEADNIQIDAVQIVWFENPLPLAATSRWEEHPIGDHYDSNENYIKDIKATDFTSDGRPEVVVRSNVAVSIFHHQNPAWKRVQYLDIHPHEGMDTGDVDCDGDPDIILNGFWLECPDNPLTDAWLEHNIDDKWWSQTGDWTANNCKVYVADLNGDGCEDVLLAHSERPGYPVSWYSRHRKNKRDWQKHIIDEVDYCHTLQAADMDMDGDIDVITGEMEKSDDPDQILIFLNSGGGTSWTRYVVAAKGIYSGKVGDVDSDGDPDIAANRNYDKPPLELWINTIRE